MIGGPEFFGGMDSGEGLSEEAFEQFKERMAGAARDLAAWQKGEQKQKKKEDELIKILLKYIQGKQKTAFIILISRMLEANVPASFVLGIILLGDKEIQQELKINLQLPKGEPLQKMQQNPNQPTTMLAIFGIEDKSLPLKARVEFEFWIKNLLDQASVHPQKIINTIEEKNDKGEPNGKAKLVTIQLTSFVLREFLSAHDIETEFDEVRDFAKFVILGILKELHQQIDQQNLLGSQNN